MVWSSQTMTTKREEQRVVGFRGTHSRSTPIRPTMRDYVQRL